jgi:hypothetical protein
MLAHLTTIAYAEVNQPDKDITGEFLRPTQGILKYISRNNLDKDNDRHNTHQHDTAVLLQILVQPFENFQVISLLFNTNLQGNKKESRWGMERSSMSAAVLS